LASSVEPTSTAEAAAANTVVAPAVAPAAGRVLVFAGIAETTLSLQEVLAHTHARVSYLEKSSMEKLQHLGLTPC